MLSPDQSRFVSISVRINFVKNIEDSIKNQLSKSQIDITQNFRTYQFLEDFTNEKYSGSLLNIRFLNISIDKAPARDKANYTHLQLYSIKS